MTNDPNPPGALQPSVAAVAHVDPFSDDREPISPGLAGALDALLKRPGRLRFALRSGRSGRAFAALGGAAAACLILYGLVAGSLSGGAQLWAAPAKILAGSVASALICFPSLYVFLCLSGASARIREVAGALVAMIALSAVLLLGLAPVAWVFSQSTDSVALMATLHLVFWGASAALGARLLARFLGTDGNPARVGAWIAIYLLVSLQMMTSLRPIIGDSETLLPTEKRFFLSHYVSVLDNDLDPERSPQPAR